MIPFHNPSQNPSLNLDRTFTESLTRIPGGKAGRQADKKADEHAGRHAGGQPRPPAQSDESVNLHALTFANCESTKKSDAKKWVSLLTPKMVSQKM